MRERKPKDQFAVTTKRGETRPQGFGLNKNTRRLKATAAKEKN